MRESNYFSGSLLIGLVLVASHVVQGGIIKDLFQKVTNTNNKTEELVRESAPICGSGIFSTPNERDLSPEIIFISSRQGRALSAHERSHQRQDQIREVAKEFRFHPENVTLDELEQHGFNPAAPVTFLMHGFTSGYPLQAWISAIVEAYTIDRELSSSSFSSPDSSPSYQHDSHSQNHHHHHHHNHGDEGHGNDNGGGETYENYNSRPSRDRQARSSSRERSSSRGQTLSGAGSRSDLVDHNLFIINWNYAARGIIYPRAVANIPIVASYVTRFINDRLIDEARVDPRRIQLIGHSLGAHLAGFIGKNTRSKVGRIYGLDPAGPCFGAISGPLYPASKRLAPSDAEEVITLQTNSALLGIERPLGRYSVFVEGGANQPGCKPSGVLKSLGSLTWDGGDFDSVSCSHSRAPNLITYRQDQRDSDENCLMVAYACKDWDSFMMGQCGVCGARGSQSPGHGRSSWDRKRSRQSPLEPVECLRIGLDWQYPASPSPSNQQAHRHHGGSSQYNQQRGRERPDNWRESNPDSVTTRRPPSAFDLNSRRPLSSSSAANSGGLSNSERNRRAAKRDDERDESQNWRNSSLISSSSSSSNSSSPNPRRDDDNVEALQMFLRTSDTQPYCAFHYQLVLELNEPFEKAEPSMSVILQDSGSDRQRRRGGNGNSVSRSSVSSDEFGNMFDDRTYTHLLTSYRKLRQIDHGTLIVRDGLKDGHRKLKALHVNYMSNPDPSVNRRLSTRLCPVKTNTDREAISGEGENRFYFKPCERNADAESSPSSGGGGYNGRDYDRGEYRD